jgi:hypothetical protein
MYHNINKRCIIRILWYLLNIIIRYRSELENSHRVHNRARSGMMVKYFAEKVNPHLHDLAAKQEAFGCWKQENLEEKIGYFKTQIMMRCDLDSYYKP